MIVSRTPEDERSFLQNRRNQRIGRKSIRLPPIPWLEKNLSQEHWGRGMEKNKVSNGELVRLRTGRLTPATFSEADSVRVHSEPRIGLRREKGVANTVLRLMMN